MDSLTIGADGISLTMDLSVGHVADLTVEAAGRRLKPLHRAPWIDEPGIEPGRGPGLALGLARLSGDFLCAPFSVNDVEPAPGHGWPANSSWHVASSAAVAGGWRAVLRLDRTVFGATIDKVLTLRDGHPFLYQEHVFSGGSGAVPVAHHPMTAMAAGGRIAFSPKRFAMTPPTPLEPDPARGRYRLAYPARGTDLTAFPAADGGVFDLTRYETGLGAEDFVILAEAAHDGPGWTAVARNAEDDLVLILKNPAELPITMLWLSNGGRDYAPWNGRHVGVLGVEDGRTAVGHAASIAVNDLTREGIPTAFPLGGHVAFRHVIGALPAGAAGTLPRDVRPDGAGLRLEFDDGATRTVAYDRAFLS